MGIDYENPSKMYLILGGEVAQIIEFDGVDPKDISLQFDTEESVITTGEHFRRKQTFTLSAQYENARIQPLPQSKHDSRHELSIDELNEILSI